MSLLIDGYNLLHASGIFASGEGPPTLERSRVALLDFLAERLEAKLQSRTTIVFDGAHAPPGLISEMKHGALSVQFSRRGASADELLEELIAAEPDPRHLLVVSSDHRIQRAARQRGASFVDSETWCAELKRAVGPQEETSHPSLDDKDAASLANPFPPDYGLDLLRPTKPTKGER